MLLVIDAGNTNITIGVFDENNLIGNFRITTQIPRTSDEYGLLLRDLLVNKSIDVKKIEDVIISSVVPKIMHSLTSAVIKYFDKEPIIVGPGIKTGIKLLMANPHEVGADRIVDAVGAYELYGGPVIVMDFGTATTYDLITADGTLKARVTSPGIRISAKALWEDAAKLPEIEIKNPATIMAQDTITSMQAGLFFGCVGQTEYIIERLKKESGIENIKTVATGGLGKIISDATDKIEIYDKDLTLQGLRLIYEKCKKNKKNK